MSEVVLTIMVICKLNTPGIQMPKEEKIVCVETLTNCLVGPNGVYLKDKIATCERKYEKNKVNKND